MRELAAADLRWRCPEEWLPWSGSEEVPRAEAIVGQDRAVEAIAFGLHMPGVGYNVFVAGLSGTGRLTTIRRFLEGLGGDDAPPDDVCFVHNFDCPDEPRALFLHAGAGRRLREAMERMVREVREAVSGALASAEFRRRAEMAVADLEAREREVIAAFEEEVRRAGFRVVKVQAGEVVHPEAVPVVGDEPVPVERLEDLVRAGTLDEARAAELRETHRKLAARMREAFEEVSRLRERMAERVEEVRLNVVRPLLDRAVRRVAEAVGDGRVRPYLDAVREDLERSLEVLASEDPDEERFLRWTVNVAVDNAQTRGRPVVLETEPTYANLFGVVERRLTRGGEAVSDFTRIRAGSLLRANGGFLVLNIEEAFLDPRVWPALKRALKYRRVQIQSQESLVLGASLLKPEPVPLDLKVVVIGDRRVYDLLYRADPDFPKIFKVLADFDTLMPLDRDRAGEVLGVLARVIDDEGLVPLDRSGMAAMLEVAVRLGRWRRRLSSRFSDLADVLREACQVAAEEGSDRVSREHVHRAVAARRRRHSLTEERVHEALVEGVIRIETEGVAVGQVNGLAVYDLGHHAFGKPARISAQVGVGREGVINIERHAGLSGPTHDKGVQILTGFLRGTFARRQPLSMACSITFEQSYGGIDGDSASSTEVYAILSALSGLPLRQDVAVTGSVDQHGNVQAIGGVNEKIEAFYRVCAARGLSGTQGVMIPAANVPDLHLDEEVVEAVAAGRFHVWAVERVEEGIELLSGVPAGRWDEERGWSEGSVYGRCERRLEEMARLLRRAGKEQEPEEGEGGAGARPPA